ncbi:MAG TPA: hypothetical protein VGW35_16800, partial [Methylomirabilota bacterium]|nr:hypothetical protein [Methylomirabilota bacterium]
MIGPRLPAFRYHSIGRPVPVFLVDTEKVGEHIGREPEGELAARVHVSPTLHAVQQLVDRRLDLPDQGLDRPGVEPAVEGLAHATVLRLVHHQDPRLEERRDLSEVVADLGRRRVDEALHAVGAQSGVGEEGGDLRVAEDEPLIERRVVEDRVVLAEVFQIREGIIQLGSGSLRKKPAASRSSPGFDSPTAGAARD